MSTAQNYHQTIFTTELTDLSTEENQAYKAQLKRENDEALIVYDIKNKQLVYHEGWLDLLGIRKGEINMLYLMDYIDPEFKDFVHKVTDSALYFFNEPHHNILEYKIMLEFKLIHQLSFESIPVHVTFFSFEADKDNSLNTFLGRFKVDRSLALTGENHRYTVYTPDKLSYIEGLDNKLFKSHHITYKELEALKLIAQGHAIKQVADKLCISHSAVEKRIYTLYKRYKVKSLPHLISFCYDNLILQLKK